MEEEDEFGDLYADVLLPASVTLGPSPSALPARSGNNDGDGGADADLNPNTGRVFTGIPFGSASSKLPSLLRVQPVVPRVQEGGDEDRVPGQATVTEEQKAGWRGEEDGCLFSRDSGGGAAGLPPQQEGGIFGVLKEDEVAGRSAEVPRQELRDDEVGVGVAEGGGASVQVTPDIDEGAADSDQEPAIPGLSFSVAPVRSGVLDGTERGEDRVSRSGDWDSDSEDDLQIVLNDDNLGLAYGNRNVAAGVEDCDYDEEDGEDDLVIVTDHDQQHPHPHHLQGTKEQEREEESAHQPLDGEEKEKSDGTRGNGEMGASPLVKTGYGSHGYQGKNHSQIKYIRPGASGLPGAAGSIGDAFGQYIRPGAAGLPGAAGGIGDAFGQVRPPLTLGPLTGRGRGRQKSFHSGYGSVLWSNGTSGRAYGSGLDFTLPSHKTIFEMDIDDFEEKPWRLPGVDVSDFFNFGLNEEKWRVFCKQLEQLRVEATLQSKIHVYESGRSEQVYDPDLPPELAAATGLHAISAESKSHGKAFEQADLVRQGRGTLCLRPQMPVGRAIQVENCFTERLPSIDTRPPRMRDADVIIEIILQNSVDVCSGALDQQPYESQGQDVGGEHENENDDKHAGSHHNDHLSPACSDGKRKDIKRKESPGPAGFADNNASEGNGVLPLDASRRCLLISKSQAPAIADDHHVASGTARDTQSSASTQCSDDSISSQSVKLQSYDSQKEKLGDTTKEEDVLQISPAVPLETVVEVILEQTNDEHGDLLALDDDAAIEKKEIIPGSPLLVDSLGDNHASYSAKKQKLNSQVEQLAFQDDGDEHGDLLALDDDAEIEKKERIPGSPLLVDSLGDNHTSHSAKKQKLNSQVEQLAFQDDGDDSRATHSDNSGAESGSSKDHLKRLAGSEEEIMQGGRTNQIRELTKHHHKEKKSSNTRDGHGQDGKHDTKRHCISFKGKEDMYTSRPHRERDSTRGEALESRKERDVSFGNIGKDVDGRRGCDDGICSRNSSNATVSERKGKLEDLRSRKHIGHGEWKGNHDRDDAPKQREKDDTSTRHGSFDDLHHKRKRDEKQPKRKVVAKEDVLHVHKAIETTHGKREKGNDVSNRRREDKTSGRGKAENHFIKHRDDDNLRHRGREDRRKLNEDMHTHKRREEDHNIGRSGRVLASKSSGGVERVNSVTKNLGLVDYPPKERRQFGEHKRGDHVKEFTHSEHKSHQKMHLHERGKTLKNERFSSHSNRTSAASNSQHVCRERHRENLKKNKEIKGVERSHLVDGDSKHEDQRHRLSEKISAKGANDQDFSKTASCLIKKGDQLINKPDAREKQRFPGNQAEVDVASDDDDGNEKERRGRSKLERWTSHKERDYSKSNL